MSEDSKNCKTENSSKAPTRMGKQELMDALLAAGYAEDQLTEDNGDKLKRPELLKMLQEHKKGETGLSAMEEVEDDDIGVAVDTEEIAEISDVFPCDLQEDDSNEQAGATTTAATPNDPEWTQYVLGHFCEDEIDGKNPRVEGLRRVAGLLVGTIIEEGCDLVDPPNQNNGFRACVKAWCTFECGQGNTRRFEALADAHEENCVEDFATYLVAMADTRAKGRVFRNALGLKRIVSAEEVNKTFAMSSDVQSGGSIHAGQISLIRLMEDRHKLNVASILDELGEKYELNAETGDVNLQSLSYETALNVSKQMRRIKEQKENG